MTVTFEVYDTYIRDKNSSLSYSITEKDKDFFNTITHDYENSLDSLSDLLNIGKQLTDFLVKCKFVYIFQISAGEIHLLFSQKEQTENASLFVDLPWELLTKNNKMFYL